QPPCISVPKVFFERFQKCLSGCVGCIFAPTLRFDFAQVIVNLPGDPTQVRCGGIYNGVQQLDSYARMVNGVKVNVATDLQVPLSTGGNLSNLPCCVAALLLNQPLRSSSHQLWG